MKENYEDNLFDKGYRLNIDGDILVYKPCCIFTDDTQQAKQMIAKNIENKVEKLAALAEVGEYQIYLTTKLNFRDFIVDDYKANRKDLVRPVNLAWAKQYAMRTMGAEVKKYLEADDLLSINQTDDTVIWSTDKDLRQVPGKHLDDATGKVVVVDELGYVEKRGTKYFFTGYKGLMFQALVGDTADYIIGCGIRNPYIVKSGKKKGETAIKRFGIGPAQAYKLLNLAEVSGKSKEAYHEVVFSCYRAQYGDNWIEALENQVNLLFMVKTYENGLITRWTYDNRVSLMDPTTGVVSDAN